MATDKKKVHFKGRYRGLFRSALSGTTHVASFYEVKWIAIEISEVQKLPFRDLNLEKVADYHYVRVMHPRRRWSFRGVDLVIIKNDTTAFAETIYDVVLINHANKREGFNPLRAFSHMKTVDNEYFVEGIIYFSLPLPIVSPKLVTETAPSFVLKDTVSTSVVPEERPKLTIESVPDPIVLADPIQERNEVNNSAQNRQGCFSSPSERSGCLSASLAGQGCSNNVGCIGGVLKLLRWVFFLWLLLILIEYFAKLLSGNVLQHRNSSGEGNVRSSELRLDPNQDTIAPQSWNYLKDHDVQWSDFIQNYYHAQYTTSTKQFEECGKRHEAWREVSFNDEMLFYHDLYEDLYRGDQTLLDSLVKYFSDQRQNKTLDALKTAEMVVTFVQEIPYVLVHDGTCGSATAQGGFIAEYHAEGKPCIGNVLGGVLSPYEFAHTMDGDCDTRSLFAYTLLERLGIRASIWVSREYGHSVLGVAVPVNSPNYKKISGLRYFGTELTAKGFRVGMIAPEHANMKNWNIVIY